MKKISDFAAHATTKHEYSLLDLAVGADIALKCASESSHGLGMVGGMYLGIGSMQILQGWKKIKATVREEIDHARKVKFATYMILGVTLTGIFWGVFVLRDLIVQAMED